MPLSVIKRNSIIGISSLLAACSPLYPPTDTGPVSTKCHGWSIEEKHDIQNADEALPKDSPLHLVIRDYQRICIALK